MTKSVLSASLAGVVFCAAIASPSVSAANPAQPALNAAMSRVAEASDALGRYAANRLVVVPSAGLSPANLANIVGAHGGRARRLGKSSLNVIDLPAGVSAKAVMAQLSKNPHLKRVELDRKVQASYVPNDPYYASAYHLAKIGTPSAWNSTQGAGVTIAILDSGVDGAHPDLAGNMVVGYNFVDNNTNTADVCGHGTAVAGSAAATSNNALGVAGVAGQAKIMPIRIGTTDASGGCTAFLSTVVSGITYAADRGARIVNVSFGPLANSAAVQNAAAYLKSKGGLLFVSAGNSGVDAGIAATSSMIVVSATDSGDSRTSWSNYGSVVSLAAPGAGIWTTSKGNIYQQWNGTSFASPVAAGVGALVMAANPSLDNLTVESLLYSTAVDLGAAARDPYFGHGRVNAAAAVAAAVAKRAPADTLAPSAVISSPANGNNVSGLVSVSVTASDNVGVNRVELKVNGTTVGVDQAAPYQFSWDSAGAANGTATLVAVAYDLAGNAGTSASVGVKVANAVPPVSETWTTCAKEGGVCTFTNTRQVRYGANNSYATLNAVGSIACNNNVFGDPMPGVAKTCQYSSTSITSTTPAPTPGVESWTVCGSEGATCSFTGTREVRYGAAGKFVSKIIAGATLCSNSVFGDPIPGTAKTCSYSSITR
jgi:subtilisin family serine protease